MGKGTTEAQATNKEMADAFTLGAKHAQNDQITKVDAPAQKGSTLDISPRVWGRNAKRP